MEYKINLEKQGEKTIETRSVHKDEVLIEILEQCYDDKVLKIEKLHNTKPMTAERFIETYHPERWYNFFIDNKPFLKKSDVLEMLKRYEKTVREQERESIIGEAKTGNTIYEEKDVFTICKNVSFKAFCKKLSKKEEKYYNSRAILEKLLSKEACENLIREHEKSQQAERKGK
jgi:hypothetical protein